MEEGTLRTGGDILREVGTPGREWGIRERWTHYIEVRISERGGDTWRRWGHQREEETPRGEDTRDPGGGGNTQGQAETLRGGGDTRSRWGHQGKIGITEEVSTAKGGGGTCGRWEIMMRWDIPP